MILQHIGNPFANPKISEEKFDKIADTHIQRLTSNNQGGAYTNLINETTPLYTAWKTAISAEAVELAVRQGRTISVNDGVRVIKQYISRKEGVIKDVFAKGSTEYEQFFPLGLTEYSKATLGNLRTLTERWITAANTFAGQLPANLGNDCQLLLDAFNTARTNQLQTAGEVIEKDSDSDIARSALAKQLYKNLCSLIIIHIDDTERVIDFYDLSITKRKEKSTYNVKVAANSVKNIVDEVPENKLFELKNTGTVNVLIYTADADNTPYQGWGINLQPGQSQKFTLAELGGLRQFLNAHNQSGSEAAITLKLEAA